jgi:NAD(P)-dependent dehydrogenase (short-subunit alcohol dehydrogenase family)
MAKGKVAIITAGGSSMDAGAAEKLAADGFRVAILSSSGKGQSLAQELGGVSVTGCNRSNKDFQQLISKRFKK